MLFDLLLVVRGLLVVRRLALLSIRGLLLLLIIGRVLLAVVGLIYFILRIIGTLLAGDPIRLSLRLIHLPQRGRLLGVRVIGFIRGIAIVSALYVCRYLIQLALLGT